MASKIILTLLFIILTIWVISTFIVIYVEDIIEKRKRRNQGEEILDNFFKE